MVPSRSRTPAPRTARLLQSQLSSQLVSANHQASVRMLQHTISMQPTSTRSPFYGANCTSSNVQSVTQIPIGCGTYQFGSLYNTTGVSATPVFGSTFPPSGFAVGSVFFNTSASGAKATGCSAGNGVVEVKSASNWGYCNVRSASQFITTPSSTKMECSTDGTTYGTVGFSDNTCTATATATTMPLPTTCTVSKEGGYASSPASCGSAATFPSDLPTTSFTTYSDSACKTVVSTTYLGSCFDSKTLSCGTVNGTDGYATFSDWAGKSDVKAGSCPTTQTATIHQALGGTCVEYPAGSKIYRMYSCSASGPGASASTASVSIVATLVAAVAAVFAVRSL
jgi:hypothetical protein